MTTARYCWTPVSTSGATRRPIVGGSVNEPPTHCSWNSIDELAAEEGADPDEVREGVLDVDRTIDHMLRRVLIVAEKQ